VLAPGAPIEEVITQLTTIQAGHPTAGRSGQHPADRNRRATSRPLTAAAGGLWRAGERRC
jgi:hypothetical protein